MNIFVRAERFNENCELEIILRDYFNVRIISNTLDNIIITFHMYLINLDSDNELVLYSDYFDEDEIYL